MPPREGEAGERVRELRLEVTCSSCGESFFVSKAQLNWSSEVTCTCGHRLGIEEVLEQLEERGWNTHELIRARGSFRDPIPNLPVPHGGAFAVGKLDERADDTERTGPARWRFRDVDEVRPADKGFELVE